MRRFNVVSAGRRWGKNILGEMWLPMPALARKPVAWYSPTYKYLQDDWGRLKALLKPLTARRDEQSKRIELLTGGVLEMWSLEDPDSGRGRKYARVLIDEASKVKHLAYAWENTIRHTLVDLRGDLLVISTPKGHNYFWQLYLKGQDPLQPEWASWQRPTHDNPHIPKDELAEIERTSPERVYQEEILAMFLADGAGIFRNVKGTEGLEQHEPLKGHHYVIGVDWGKYEDFSVFAVVDVNLQALVHIERYRQIDYEFQGRMLHALCARFNPQGIIAERNAMGDPIVERLIREGLPVRPFLTTNESKRVVIEALALGIERGDLTLLDDPILIAELQSFAAERLPSGLLRYGAPEGMHDDCVIALALAWSEARLQTVGKPSGDVIMGPRRTTAEFPW